MTSTFATNFISRGLERQKWLETDDEGAPLQRQVPLTYQVYSGQGNETIVYDGSNCLVIENALTSGALTMDFTQMHNYFGRFLHLVIKSTLANNFIMNFAPGTVIIPGVPTPQTSTTTPATFGPVSGVLNFFAVDQCMFIKNTLTLPQTILPGNDGDVLTTDSGVVQWLPPAGGGSAPRLLSFPILVDPSNELNFITQQPIKWNEGGLFVNDTDINFTGQDLFEIVTEGIYDIDVEFYSQGNANVGLTAAIILNGGSFTLAQTFSNLSLSGLTLHIYGSFHLYPGGDIQILCGNRQGPDSSTQSITPQGAANGRINIKQFIV